MLFTITKYLKLQKIVFKNLINKIELKFKAYKFYYIKKLFSSKYYENYYSASPISTYFKGLS